MADFHYTINGTPKQIRRLTLDELVVINDFAYEESRAALLKDKSLVHDIDSALADLRERKAGTSLLWQYITSLHGAKKVLEQLDMLGDADHLLREEMLEIVGRACGFTVTVKREAEKVADETNPTSDGSG